MSCHLRTVTTTGQCDLPRHFVKLPGNPVFDCFGMSSLIFDSVLEAIELDNTTVKKKKRGRPHGSHDCVPRRARATTKIGRQRADAFASKFLDKCLTHSGPWQTNIQDTVAAYPVRINDTHVTFRVISSWPTACACYETKVSQPLPGLLQCELCGHEAPFQYSERVVTPSYARTLGLTPSYSELVPLSVEEAVKKDWDPTYILVD